MLVLDLAQIVEKRLCLYGPRLGMLPNHNNFFSPSLLFFFRLRFNFLFDYID